MIEVKKVRPPNLFTRRMLETFSTCRARYHTEYEMDYRLKRRRPWPWPPTMKFALHAALRERDFALTRGIGKLRVLSAGDAVLDTYARQLMKSAFLPPVENKNVKKVEELLEQTKRIIAHYNDVHEADIAGEGMKFLTTSDGRPMVDYLSTDSLWIPEGEPAYNTTPYKRTAPWQFAERIDGIIKRDGLPPAVLIRRLTSSTDPVEVERELALDLTIPGMMWAASRLIGDFVLSAVVDVVRIKPPSVPETVKCRSCKGNGQGKYGDDGGSGTTACQKCGGTGVGGMSKKPCDTTLDIWEAEVRKHGLDVTTEWQRCKPVVERIREKGESFAYRIHVETSEQALRKWNSDAYMTADEIAIARKSGHWPRNPAACVGVSGPCPYRRACSQTADSDLAWFTREVEPYPGLDN